MTRTSHLLKRRCCCRCKVENRECQFVLWNKERLMCSYIDDNAIITNRNVSKVLKTAQKSRDNVQSVKSMTRYDVTKRTMFPHKMDFSIIFYVLLFLQMVNISRYIFYKKQLILVGFAKPRDRAFYKRNFHFFSSDAITKVTLLHN